MFLDYLSHLQAYGKLYFTVDQAIQDLDATKNVVYAAVKRLKKKGLIMSPAKGLYVIVPNEYLSQGCLPPEQLISIFMKYVSVDYYAGLLTAALYHGATHQKPGVFQVVSNKQFKKALKFGQIRIDFIYKKSLKMQP